MCAVIVKWGAYKVSLVFIRSRQRAVDLFNCCFLRLLSVTVLPQSTEQRSHEHLLINYRFTEISCHCFEY